MKVKYDKKADAKYIQVRTGKISRTEKLNDWVLIDYSKNDEIIGIEILNASEYPVGVTLVADEVAKTKQIKFPKNDSETIPTTEIKFEDFKEAKIEYSRVAA